MVIGKKHNGRVLLRAQKFHERPRRVRLTQRRRWSHAAYVAQHVLGSQAICGASDRRQTHVRVWLKSVCCYAKAYTQIFKKKQIYNFIQ
jgi:hypothetical protein